MRETPMHKSEKSLLPMRRKMSAPAISNFETHATEQAGGDKETTNPAGRKERLFSVSSRTSFSSSKYEPSLSERSLTPPFTPPRNSDTIKNFTQSFHLRRPSEHFLEVLGTEKRGEVLPKVLSATSLPPLRKPNNGENLLERIPGEIKIAFSGSVCNGFSKPTSGENQPLLYGAKKAFAAPNLTNRKALQKTNSLPLIKTYSTHTDGLNDMNGPIFRNRTKSAVVRPEEKLEPAPLPFDENLEDRNIETEAFDENAEELNLEKFSMICSWLKGCEEAKIV